MVRVMGKRSLLGLVQPVSPSITLVSAIINSMSVSLSSIVPVAEGVATRTPLVGLEINSLKSSVLSRAASLIVLIVNVVVSCVRKILAGMVFGKTGT